MCLRNSDLNITTIRPCYLTHPARNEDTDDVLLDTANQLDLTRRDLVQWVVSKSSWHFMSEFAQQEIDVNDFSKELERLCA